MNALNGHYRRLNGGGGDDRNRDLGLGPDRRVRPAKQNRHITQYEDHAWLLGSYSTPAAKIKSVLLDVDCPAAPSRTCLLGRKSQIRNQFPVDAPGSGKLSTITQKICDESGSPILILLNEKGAALFVPGAKARRILPADWRNSSLSPKRAQVFFDLVSEALTHEAKAHESFDNFVRRVLANNYASV